MAKFAVALKRTLSLTASIGNVVADSVRPKRGYLYYWSIGSESAPGDNNIEIQLKRCNATPTATGTSVTPSMIDAGDALTEADALQNLTVEPGDVANSDMFREVWNQKYGAKWYAPPGGEIVYPATASFGFRVLTPVCTSGTPFVTFECHIDEK